MCDNHVGGYFSLNVHYKYHLCCEIYSLSRSSLSLNHSVVVGDVRRVVVGDVRVVVVGDVRGVVVGDVRVVVVGDVRGVVFFSS